MNDTDTDRVEVLTEEVRELRRCLKGRLDDIAAQQAEIRQQLPGDESLQTKSDCFERHTTMRWILGGMGVVISGIAGWIGYLHLEISHLRAILRNLNR